MIQDRDENYTPVYETCPVFFCWAWIHRGELFATLLCLYLAHTGTRYILRYDTAVMVPSFTAAVRFMFPSTAVAATDRAVAAVNFSFVMSACLLYCPGGFLEIQKKKWCTWYSVDRRYAGVSLGCCAFHSNGLVAVTAARYVGIS